MRDQDLWGLPLDFSGGHKQLAGDGEANIETHAIRQFERTNRPTIALNHQSIDSLRIVCSLLEKAHRLQADRHAHAGCGKPRGVLDGNGIQPPFLGQAPEAWKIGWGCNDLDNGAAVNGDEHMECG